MYSMRSFKKKNFHLQLAKEVYQIANLCQLVTKMKYVYVTDISRQDGRGS